METKIKAKTTKLATSKHQSTFRREEGAGNFYCALFIAPFLLVTGRVGVKERTWILAMGTFLHFGSAATTTLSNYQSFQ